MTNPVSEPNLAHLRFLERLPKLTTSGQAPVLFLFHGRAAEAKTIFSIEGLLSPELHVIAIEAPYPSEKGGFEWFKPDPTEPSEEITDSSRFDEAERLLTADVQWHLERIRGGGDLSMGLPFFFWGFSQGAAMSLILGLRGNLSRLIEHGPRGVIPMGGFLPNPIRHWTEWDRTSSYFFVHGTNDEVLPPESSLRAKAFLDSLGITTEYHEYKGRHKMTLDSITLINEWILKLGDMKDHD